MVLHEKALEFDEVRIDLGKKEQLKPDYLALNPNGVVPTLVDDGVPIIESSVICEYLDEKYPAEPAGSVRSSSNGRACAPGRITSKKSPSAPFACRPSIARFFIASRRSTSSSSRAQEIGPRPVRRELFQRMGSPKGFCQG